MCELPCGKKGIVNPGVWGAAGSWRQVPSSSGCCGLQPKMSTGYQELPKSCRFLTPSNQTPSISRQSTGLPDIPQFCYFAIFLPHKFSWAIAKQCGENPRVMMLPSPGDAP